MLRKYTDRERAYMTNESYSRYYNSPKKKESGIVAEVSFLAIGLIMLGYAICKLFGVL